MKVNLFDFQQKAVTDLRIKSADAVRSYNMTKVPQVISFTAPTGAGKTIVMASLIESVFFGDENVFEQPEAIFIWLSDSPQLNEQSRMKLILKADRINISQCVTVADESFDKPLFDDGHIYFLNTQKLSKTSNLTQQGDGRTYTIWQTIANTVREKSDRLYFIIDEAHRGMNDKNAASKATTIMQKFIKGSPEDHIPPMPVVIGMSATPARFNNLVKGTTSTIHKTVITAQEVRSSGLLKDRIIITYPEESTMNKDMAILQAAADNWKEKWDHWSKYCTDQSLNEQVNPVFVIQVLNGTGEDISDTDLDDCLRKIEERTGFQFSEGEVVHTFGTSSSDIKINNLTVPYIEPSSISENKRIKVVFFKENLSTGWDCPRAETMMSFRRAVDSTYIAQLLGRMIRTPLQCHIDSDEVLNDVHLYLPYFDRETVNDIADALQNAEGGNIPTDVEGESAEKPQRRTYTANPTRNPPPRTIGQISISDIPTEDSPTHSPEKPPVHTPSHPPVNTPVHVSDSAPPVVHEPVIETPEDDFDRAEVMRFINNLGIPSYEIRTVRIQNYLTSLLKLVHLLTQIGLDTNAVNDVHNDIIQKIHDYIDTLKNNGDYDDLVMKVKQFKLQSKAFDPFGRSVESYFTGNLSISTDTDIDRQLRLCENKLSDDGIGFSYGKKYIDVNDPNAYKIDVILYVHDPECMNKLQEYAKIKFHSLHDNFRRKIALSKSDSIRQRYDRIISDGDIVSEHSFRLPEIIKMTEDKNGKEYKNHLFVNYLTGTAKFNLNSWEAGVIEEEAKSPDFVCWIRNPSRALWSLTIPYEINDEIKPMYPDFIIVRKDDNFGFVIDILEPHGDQYADNMNKAKGLAEYANKNTILGRIQLIREIKDAWGNKKFKRLDMNQSLVRDKVLKAKSNEELNHIFDTDGFFM